MTGPGPNPSVLGSNLRDSFVGSNPTALVLLINRLVYANRGKQMYV